MFRYFFKFSLLLLIPALTTAQSTRQKVSEGNQLYAEEKLWKIKNLEAANLFMGGARELMESANSMLDPSFKQSLIGYSEKLLGRSYFSIANHHNYNEKDFCAAHPYYLKAKEHFKRAFDIFTNKKSQELTRTEEYLRLSNRRAESTLNKCKNKKGLKDVTQIPPAKPKVIITKPEPLFFP